MNYYEYKTSCTLMLDVVVVMGMEYGFIKIQMLLVHPKDYFINYIITFSIYLSNFPIFYVQIIFIHIDVFLKEK